MAVEGVEKLMRQFNQLGSMEPVVYKSVKRQAEVVRGVAVKLCPVYSPKEMVSLIRSLTTMLHTRATSSTANRDL